MVWFMSNSSEYHAVSTRIEHIFNTLRPKQNGLGIMTTFSNASSCIKCWNFDWNFKEDSLRLVLTIRQHSCSPSYIYWTYILLLFLWSVIYLLVLLKFYRYFALHHSISVYRTVILVVLNLFTGFAYYVLLIEPCIIYLLDVRKLNNYFYVFVSCIYWLSIWATLVMHRLFTGFSHILVPNEIDHISTICFSRFESNRNCKFSCNFSRPCDAYIHQC